MAFVPASDTFAYVVIGLVLFGIAGTFTIIRRQLTASKSTWSLSDALSEDTEMTVADAKGLPYTVDGIVVKQTRLVASTSRLIALVGTVAILFMFLGFGSFTLWGFAKTGEVPASISQVITFLLSGMALFAPYAVNKASSVFSGQ